MLQFEIANPIARGSMAEDGSVSFTYDIRTIVRFYDVNEWVSKEIGYIKVIKLAFNRFIINETNIDSTGKFASCMMVLPSICRTLSRDLESDEYKDYNIIVDFCVDVSLDWMIAQKLDGEVNGANVVIKNRRQ